MIQKFAATCGLVESELVNLNHTSNSMSLVSLKSAKFAQAVAAEWRRTSQDGTPGEIPLSVPARSRLSQDRLICDFAGAAGATGPDNQALAFLRPLN